MMIARTPPAAPTLTLTPLLSPCDKCVVFVAEAVAEVVLGCEVEGMDIGVEVAVGCPIVAARTTPS